MRKYSVLIIILLILLVSAAACTSKTGLFTDVSAFEAMKIIETNRNNPEFVILDIRTTNEFSEGRLAGAVNVDFYAESFRADLKKLDREKTYLVYCRSGNRSGQSRPFFVEPGFREVYHLESGINSWKAEGYPVVQ